MQQKFKNEICKAHTHTHTHTHTHIFEKYGVLLCEEKQLRLFLVNEQRDVQSFSMYLFLFLTFYMFRAHRAHHQERQIVSIQPLVAVTLYR